MTNEKNSPLSPSGIRDPGSGIRIVGIIGEGRMGTSIFYSLLGQPFALRWIGSPAADSGEMLLQLERRVRRSLRNGIISREEHDRQLSSVISTDLRRLSDCDLVIEAIPEMPEMKRVLFSELATVTPPGCILASNSSSMNPSVFFVGKEREPFIIGIHYFYPVAVKETVELILTEKTTPEVREKTLSFLIRTGKLILELNESNSFILNKLFLDIQNEAYRIVEQGKATIHQVDALVREHLFPIGIFDFMDGVGIDTMLPAIRNYTGSYPHRDYYAGLISRLEKLASAGKLGRKSGEGFYTYREGERALPQDEKPLSLEATREIVEHLRFTYLNAAKRFTIQSRCTIDEMNDAIRDYLGLDKGPFE